MLFLKKSNKALLFFAVLLSCVLLDGCSHKVDEVRDDQDVSHTLIYDNVTEEDLREDYSFVKEYNLNEYTEDIYITEGGDYLLSGNYKGTIFVDSNEYPVHLFLNNINISSGHDNAIYIKSASKVVITCMKGTNNTISDNAYYTDSEEFACIFSESDLTINGEGTLVITGLYDDGIHVKDYLKILDSDLHVKAKGNGIKGNDGIVIRSSGVLIEAEKNGLVTSNYVADRKGYIDIESTQLKIVAGQYGIVSVGDLVIRGEKTYIKGIMGEYRVAGEIIDTDGSLLDG